ncbi:hypothetical protein PSPTOT1_2914 [Pseudomonas syringae pv. tomato T1]|nr:hypothetical protein PSPTOT1_2914 [Pseudomonas syringae pv. tomato T1]
MAAILTTAKIATHYYCLDSCQLDMVRSPWSMAYRELIEDFPTIKEKPPFAFDEGGNYFLLSSFGHDQGEVGLWIIDTEEHHSVAESFSELLIRLSA